jgi:IMP cyclohydrolase
MNPSTIAEYLAERPYPGRGLLLCRSANDITVSIFLTGRSRASQARRIIRQDGALEVVPTEDVSEDPLRHYHGLVTKDLQLFAGNGRHVSEIAASANGPSTTEEEFSRLTYEPDPPIYTPRISAAVDLGGAPLALLGIAARGRSGDVEHQFRQVNDLAPGETWLMHTYDGNVDTPNASGFIVRFLGDSFRSVGALDTWNALDPRYRVAIGSVTTPYGSRWADGEWSTEQRGGA